MTVQLETQGWTGVAPGWDRLRREIEESDTAVTARLLAGLPPLEGARVLELGAGAGELSARLAAAVGSSGSVVSSDAAGGMVELLRARLAGLDNVEVAQLDACAIDLGAAGVDAVVFRMGLMMAPDPAHALAQIRRVLRPGGRFVTSVWGAPQANPWLLTVGMAAMMEGLVNGGPPVGPGEPFSLADPAALEHAALEAGFTDVEVGQVDELRRYADISSYVDMVTSLAPPIAAAVAQAPAERIAALQRRVGELAARFQTADDGVEIPAQAHVLWATAP
jgi:SAM-dependent methyltransferase